MCGRPVRDDAMNDLMKIFVPAGRYVLLPQDPKKLSSIMVEVPYNDLGKINHHWKQTNMEGTPSGISDIFTPCVSETFKRNVIHGTFEPFLRRPHIVLHGGSKDGADHCKDQFAELAEAVGRLVAANGFCLWYGGSKEGLMGGFIKGFKDVLENNGPRDDQYSVQVLPSGFVFAGERAHGMRASNEGLSHNTDAAIIVPDFVTRLELLSSRSAAAITCPGGSGTLNEWSHVLVHDKTGLRDIPLYTLNPLMGGSQEGYYDFLLAFMEKTVEHGLESGPALDFITRGIRQTPEQIFKDLMQRLERSNALPDQVYKAYCEKNSVKPWEAKKMKRTARSDKYSFSTPGL